ncbi:MAG: efflux RND transporter permease subunit, partial [Acidobacteriota bacterium]
ATGRIQMVFFPEVPGNTITVQVNMDPGSPESLTRLGADRLEAAVATANRQLIADHGLSSPPIARVMVVVAGRLNIEAYGELTREAMDSLGTAEVLNAWRLETGELEGANDMRFSGSFETGGGFALQIVGRDEQMLKKAVELVSSRLSSVAGVYDVRSDLQGDQPELHIRLTPEARHLGFTRADLAAQIGDGFGGYEVQRMQRDDDEVKVYVRYPEERRQSLHEVLTSEVVTPEGRWVPLDSVAVLESGYGSGAIVRRDGKRAATIEATLDKRVTGAADVLRAIEQDLADVPERWPGLEVRRSGELEEMGEIQDGLREALAFIAVLIFALLAIPLRSYVKPLVIMSVIPFAFMGAAFGHLFMDLPLSILSFFGVLAATGVVVNDSLVMVSRYNQLRGDGLALREALIETGCSRFRAIFLTTATTVSGLMPLMLETSEQAQYLIPAAVSLAFAELLATPIALFLVPIMLHVLHDLSSWTRRRPFTRTEHRSPAGQNAAERPVAI